MRTFQKKLFFLPIVFLVIFTSNKYVYSESNNQWVYDQKGCKHYNGVPIVNQKVIWNGKCKNGYADGKGVVEWYLNNGKRPFKYIGKLKKGYAEGRAIFIYSDGTKYVGDFSNNKMTGRGTLTSSDGKMEYIGDFVENQFTGKGSLKNSNNGQIYVGEFKTGKRTGKGSLTYGNGEKYVGGFRNDQFNENGIYTWPNGQKYIGNFIDGKATGKGILSFSNRDKYIGDFIDNKRTGKGSYTWANGQKYVGDFIDGNINNQVTKNINTDNDPCYQKRLDTIQASNGGLLNALSKLSNLIDCSNIGLVSKSSNNSYKTNKTIQQMKNNCKANCKAAQSVCESNAELLTDSDGGALYSSSRQKALQKCTNEKYDCEATCNKER